MVSELEKVGDLDSISIVKDACTEAQGVLKEAASVAIEQIECAQPNVEAILLLFNLAALEFLALLPVLVSVLVKVYFNKVYR